MKNYENMKKASETIDVLALVSNNELDTNAIEANAVAKLYLSMFSEMKKGIDDKRFTMILDSDYIFSHFDATSKEWNECSYARIVDNDTKKSVIQVYFKDGKRRAFVNYFFSNDKKYTELFEKYGKALDIVALSGTSRVGKVSYEDTIKVAKKLLALLSFDTDTLERTLAKERAEKSA